MDRQERAHGNASSAPTFERVGRETNQRNHRDHPVLSFPGDDGLSARRACAAPERRQELGRVTAKSSGKRVTVPIWIASDHFMVGWGRVETLPPTLLFVDTGLVGAGVKLAESVIKEAGVKLEENRAAEGAGGGGTLKIVPYTVHQLSFGDIKEENVPGLYDGPFPWHYMFGFHSRAWSATSFSSPTR